MRTHMYHLTAATVAGLIAWSGPAPLPATEYEATDYMPLAVGNSWTFQHQWDDYFDRFGSLSQWPAYLAARRAADPAYPSLTITVERTEKVDGNTYYVLSGMPAKWPPAPPHFVAGKKLRWDGTRLVEHTGTGEQALYRFDGANEDGYSIPTTEGDNLVKASIRQDSRWRVPRYRFGFHGHVWPRIPGLDPPEDEPFGYATNRNVVFQANYGISWAADGLFATDYAVFENVLRPVQATLAGATGGVTGQSGTRVVRIEDARTGRTAVSPSSWGEVKGER